LLPEIKLIIELDGGHHFERQDYDNDRTVNLEANGYKVVRFWNTEIFENIDGVLETIFGLLNKPPP